jgi:hypothetical protein
MKHQIQLIAMDVDGTLLDDDKFIAPGAAEAIQAVKARGVMVALVTGRNKPTLRWILDELDLWGPFIGSGGAYVADLSTGKIIEQHTLPMEDVHQLIVMARKHHLFMFVDHAEWMLCELEPVQYREIKRLHKYAWQVVPDLLAAIPEPPLKALVLGDHEKLEEIKKYFETNHRPVHLAFTANTSMDMVSQDVNKGHALTVLAGYLNIPLNKIAVIGDYDNDLEMFHIAGVSVAMGNAPEIVKRTATFIAPNNNEGGLAWALNKIILEDE